MIRTSALKIRFHYTTKHLGLSNLKSIANDKLNEVRGMEFVFDRTENILGKGKKAGYQHSLLFPKCFSALSSLWVGKTRDFW